MDVIGGISQPQVGDRVVFMSGRLAGTVLSTTREGFTLKSPAGERLWLRQDAIFTADIGRVTLVCEHGGLVNYRS